MALAEVQSLQKRASRVMEFEAEVRKIKEINEQLKVELSALKPLEQENKRLQKLTEEMSDNLGSRMELQVSKLKEETDRVLLDKEHELMLLRTETAEKLCAMEDKCTSLTKALELAQSEVFKLKLQRDRSDLGRSSEVELLMDELDKAHVKIKDLEEALSNSDSGLASASLLTETDDRIRHLQSRVDELEADLVDKDHDNNILTSALNKLRMEWDESSNSASRKSAELEQSVASLTAQLADAQKQLAEQSDYAEIARELALLRSVEFPEEYNSTNRSQSGSGSASQIESDRNSLSKPPLEVLLMNKNRHLQNEVAELNANKDRMMNELNRLRLYETESRQQAQEHTELIRLLESDLYRLQTALNAPGRMPILQSVSQLATPAGYQRGISNPISGGTTFIHDHDKRRESQMLAEAMGEQQDVNHEVGIDHSGTEATRTNNSEPNVVDTSLLQIVQHQRDRFRARAEELEQSEASVRQHLTNVQRELESVRADNVKLYEKIRFLQSYSNSIGVRSDSRSFATSNSSADRVSVQLDSDPTVMKYSRAYEAHMDPFNQFSRQEKQRFYHDLKPYEKVMLRLGRLVLGNRRARFMAFAYALIIHILIFLALYNAAYFQKSAAEAESSCMLRFGEHMRAHHPEMANNLHP